MKPILILFLFFPSFSTFAQGEDEKLIVSTIGRLYSALSFEDSSSLHVDSIIVLFTPTGKLIANFARKPVELSVKEYCDNLIKRVRRGDMEGAKEREVFRKVDIFGNVAQVLSSYELTLIIKGKPVVRRGVNLMQLLKVDRGWLVSSLIWDRENENLKLPSKYLSGK